MKKNIIIFICIISFVFSNLFSVSIYAENLTVSDQEKQTDLKINNIDDELKVETDDSELEYRVNEENERVIVIDLKDKTRSEQQEILEAYGIKYKEESDYDRIEIVSPSDFPITRSGAESIITGVYNGKQYIITYLYDNKVTQKTVNGKNTIIGDLVDKGIKIFIGFVQPDQAYLWIPYTLLGITPLSIGAKDDPGNYTNTIVNAHRVEKNYCFNINGTNFSYAVFERLEIEERTNSYLLVDKEKKRYRSLSGIRWSFYETPNYRNKAYGLKKAEEMWKQNFFDGYWEYVDIAPNMKVNTISYQTHIQNIGWQGQKIDGELSGTFGKSLRLEAIKIKVDNSKITGKIEYRTHVQNTGWQSWVSNGAVSGTTGKNLRLEAIQIRLTGALKENYNVYYRTHVQNIGWQSWVKDGATSGTTGKNLRLEAIQIQLRPK